MTQQELETLKRSAAQSGMQELVFDKLNEVYQLVAPNGLLSEAIRSVRSQAQADGPTALLSSLKTSLSDAETAFKELLRLFNVSEPLTLPLAAPANAAEMALTSREVDRLLAALKPFAGLFRKSDAEAPIRTVFEREVSPGEHARVTTADLLEVQRAVFMLKARRTGL